MLSSGMPWVRVSNGFPGIFLSVVYSNWLYFICNFYGMIETNNVNNGVCNVTCSYRSSKDICLEYMENTVH